MNKITRDDVIAYLSGTVPTAGRRSEIESARDSQPEVARMFQDCQASIEMLLEAYSDEPSEAELAWAREMFEGNDIAQAQIEVAAALLELRTGRQPYLPAIDRLLGRRGAASGRILGRPGAAAGDQPRKSGMPAYSCLAVQAVGAWLHYEGPAPCDALRIARVLCRDTSTHRVLWACLVLLTRDPQTDNSQSDNFLGSLPIANRAKAALPSNTEYVVAPAVHDPAVLAFFPAEDVRELLHDRFVQTDAELQADVHQLLSWLTSHHSHEQGDS